jgi:hypothetical protein
MLLHRSVHLPLTPGSKSAFRVRQSYWLMRMMGLLERAEQTPAEAFHCRCISERQCPRGFSIKKSHMPRNLVDAQQQ